MMLVKYSCDGVRVARGSHTPKLKIFNETPQHSASSMKSTNSIFTLQKTTSCYNISKLKLIRKFEYTHCFYPNHPIHSRKDPGSL